MALVQTPSITDSVVQSFFIEALGGSQSPLTYLDRFPDSIYNKAFDSLLVKFLYTLMGPVGVGLLRQEHLEARLQIEAAGLQTTDLDKLYANVFGFARLVDESYALDASASLLPATQRDQILTSDASFRNRAIDFLKGARGGTTLAGLTLVAKSGLGRPVELIENYRVLFDHFSDVQLNLPSLGITNSVAEVTVVPRQTLPKSAVQTLSLSGGPTQGWFTMTYPVGQLWTAIPVSTVAGSSTITVPDASRLPAGVFITLTNLPTTASQTQIDPTQPYWNNATLYAQSNGGAGTSISLIQPISGTSPGSAATAPATGNFIALVGVTQTTLLPYNASAAQVQNALNSLSVIGTGNVVCSGGPLPDQSVTIKFINQLADQPVPTLQVNINPDKATGVTPVTVGTTQQISDILFNILHVAGSVVATTTGISSTSQATTIGAADQHALYAAVNRTKPMTALFTTQPGSNRSIQQTTRSSFQGSNQINVTRYAAGRSIQWPPPDRTHWIEAGVEHEAPIPYGVNTSYQGFHDVANVYAYTEQALTDVAYHSTVNLTKYWNSLIGNYSEAQLALYPGLSAYNAAIGAPNQFAAINAIAAIPEPLILSTLEGAGVINNVYPVDYLGLDGVTLPGGGLVWSSLERTNGIDYLEIDLGRVQAVNYMYLEATNKPYLIDIAYDTLDQYPYRQYTPVTYAPATVGASITSLNYQATQLWNSSSINYTNSLGKMIYTRFIRLSLTKVPVGTVYGPIGFNSIPYSIEIRNLRLGRYVS